ncbi:MAG: dihydroorotase, partial [Prochlorococcaceae cyanobacterium]
EMGQRPVLLAPRDPSLAAGGFVRDGVEALRMGWPTDPALSETLPLQTLLTLAEAHPERQLRLMNLSTAEGVRRLQGCPQPPLATVSWWHLLADSGRLEPTAEGWRVEPSLGGPADREALIAALAGGLITAVAVQHTPLDAEELLLPIDQRRAGVSGHDLVLPLLWQELVLGRGWSPAQLWQALSWGPSRVLGEPPERLQPGSRRWLLFDPALRWHDADAPSPSLAANRPWRERPRLGRVLACGLSGPEGWLV